jgi:hypothetical protein
VPDRPEDDQRHQRDVQEQHRPGQLSPAGLSSNTFNSQLIAFLL